ncbi:MAG: IPT/TIG domain-containing protein [Gemmatimonadota bacterium]
MRTRFVKIRWVLPLMGSLFACSGEDGPGSGPFEPAPAPTISAIEPAEAAPGDPITIQGEFDARQASVTIDGVDAEVRSRSAAAIVAIVPEVAAGAVPVVVTVGSRSSAPFAFRVSPAALPVITGIEPARARPGDRITITGTNLEGPGVSVTVGGKRASVMAASATAVVVVVPDLPPGTTAVVLTARDRTSNEFAYELLQAVPLIHGVLPNPTRAELPFTIFGRHLSAAEPRVLLDGAPLEIVSRSATEIVTRVSQGTALGVHELLVQVGEERSATLSLEVDDFSVTGIYQVTAVITKVGPRNPILCPGPGPSVGTSRITTIRLGDNRPLLVANVDGAGLSGRVDSRGRFSAESSGSRITGSVTPRLVDGRAVYEIDTTIDRLGILGICGRQEHATGTRR